MKNVRSNRVPDDQDVEYQFGFDQASNQVIKEVITKTIYKNVEGRDGAQGFKLFRRDGKIFKGFDLVAQVMVGFKQNSFTVKWCNKKAFEDIGLQTADIDKELRAEFAKWCL